MEEIFTTISIYCAGEEMNYYDFLGIILVVAVSIAIAVLVVWR